MREGILERASLDTRVATVRDSSSASTLISEG
jgi:hypothetical protein